MGKTGSLLFARNSWPLPVPSLRKRFLGVVGLRCFCCLAEGCWRRLEYERSVMRLFFFALLGGVDMFLPRLNLLVGVSEVRI